MTPQDWARMSWPARNRYLARIRVIERPALSIVEMARQMQSAAPADPAVGTHLAALAHYTSTPRKRTA